MDITELRTQIDAIDEQLISLFIKRMDVAQKIGEYKKAHDLPILDPVREQEKLNDVAAKAGGDMAQYARTLYATLFALSRSYQAAPDGEVAE